MIFNLFPILALGLLGSSAFAADSGRGSNPPSNLPDATCNKEPDISGNSKLFKVRGSGLHEGTNAPRASTPPPPSSGMLQMVKRSGKFAYDPTCDAAPPPGSQFGGGFPNMRSIIEQAVADAMTMATRAKDIPQDHPAYKHYFETNAGQYANVKKLFAAISDGDQAYSVLFNCDFGGDCTSKSFAATDHSSGGANDQKLIRICKSFFTEASTRFFLFQAAKGQNPSVPFRDNTASGWCRTGRTANFFATAGHTILHELTHLDAVGSAGGLSGVNNEHGTDDYQRDTNTLCELLSARKYLDDWRKDQQTDKPDDEKLPSPDYNAESYAAAGTELYFSQICSFTEIKPRTLGLVDPTPSNPQCNDTPDTKLENAQAMNKDLDSRGGFQCCSSGKGGCVNISSAGNQATDLCTAPDDKSVLCVDCAKVANYLDGLIGACTKDGQVGGKQDIVEAPGLSIQV